jgi:hypothetical protein
MKLKPRFFLEADGGDGGSNGGGGTLLGGAASTAAATTTTTSAAKTGDGDADGASSAWDFRSSLDDKGNFKPGWDASLPDDLKPSAAALAKYPNPLELMRGHANASKLIGQKATLKAPAPDAPPAEVEKFNSQIREVLGVPAKVEDYKLTKPENLPEGLTWSDDKAKDFATLAHSLNIPPAAADKIAAWQLTQMSEAVQKGQGQIEAWKQSQVVELKKDWGADYDANLGLAAKAAQVAGFDINDGELANNAKFVKAMLTVSKLIKPDALVGSDKSTSVMDGAAQAEDIRRNPNNPWHAAYMGKEGPSRQQEAANLMARLKGVKVE